MDNDDFKDDTLTEAITSHRTVVLVQPENKAWVMIWKAVVQCWQIKRT